MKIGVYFTSSKSHGGIYQYSTTLLEALAEIPEHRYVIFTNSKDIPRNIRKNKRLKIIEKEKTDLMFYTTSTNISFLCKVPAVVPIHDIMHRVHPRFPEVSAKGMWESREFAFQNIANSAFGILVDSDVGKEDLIKYYNPNPDRIIILPFLPPKYLSKGITEGEAE